ncbi:RDD family protein [Streptomyces flavidovirens]|uniref:RDD family protein n=1 Tax=Streptomyces flavidovirens TaxID=67298 RepID=UPI000996A2E7|nr:RDD family protein [Streptomyces flavidovirens]
MSAPTPASGDSSPTPGYYPDPSIPGYVRFWNGASWVPGTSRPAPPDGEVMPAAPAGAAVPTPAPAPSPSPSVEETGPVFFDEEPEGAHLHGNTPEPASAWQADTSRQTGFGGERDRRVSWGSATADAAAGGPSSGPGGRPSAPGGEPGPGGRQGSADTSGSASGGSEDPRRAPAAGHASGGQRRGGGGVDLRRTGGSSPEAASGAAPGAPGERDGRGTAADPSGGALPGVRKPGRTSPRDDGTVTIRALRRGAGESPRTAQADGTMAIRTMTPGAGRPQVPAQGQDSGQGHTPGQGNVAGQGHASGQGHAAGQGHASGQGHAPGQAQPSGQGVPGQGVAPGQGQTPGQSRTPGQAQLSGQGRAVGQGVAPGQGQTPGQGHASGQAQASAPFHAGGHGQTPGQAAGRASGSAQAAGQGQGPGQGNASGQGGRAAQAAGQGLGQGQVPGQGQGPSQRQAGAQAGGGVAAAAPVSAGAGGGAASWAQQVHQLAQPDRDEAGAPPVVPWKPPVSDPFLQAAQAQAAARPAGLAKRLAARLIDTVVLGAAVSAVAVPLVSATLAHIDEKIEAAKLSGETVTVWLLDGTTAGYLGIVLGTYLLIGVVYEVLPTAKWGRTLGKKLCRMHVRDIEAHEPPTFGAALRRWLVYGLLGVLAIGVVNAAWCLFDRPWRQCWHDKAARTFVAGD